MSHAEYNEAIQNAKAEELLLNLVRLKYRDQPLMLDIGSVSTQFEINHSGGASGTLNENVGQSMEGLSSQFGLGGAAATGTLGSNTGRVVGRNPDSLQLFGNYGYSERPTLTFSPLRGNEFVSRVMSHISLETIILLSNTGWRIDRIFRLAVQEMNGLDNAGAASGPTPQIGPRYQDFVAVCDALRDLQLDGAIWLEQLVGTQSLSDPIPASQMTPEIFINAASNDMRFRPTGDGHYVLTKENGRKTVIRIAEKQSSASALRRFREALKLTPGQSEYEVIISRRIETLGADGLRTKIAIDTRSLLGILFYLSQSVQSPAAHERAGLLTVTKTETGEPYDWGNVLGELITIRSSKMPPLNAAVAIRHRSYWFSISDDDLNSKSTFALLGQVFALQAGTETSVAPVLTLPIGG